MDTIDLIYYFLLSGAVSFFLCGLILVLSKYVKIGLDVPSSAPQKFHEGSIPRIGGIAIYGAIIFYSLIAEQAELTALLALSASAAFLGGIGEDVTGKFSPKHRLWLTFISAGIAWFLVDAQLHRVGVYIFDDMLAEWSWLSLIFTMFAVGGVSHSVNIIDGYNGLMAGVSMLAGSFLALIAWQFNDGLMLQLCLLMICSIFGFYLWNFPYGKLFMGDGGSYLVGFWLAEIAVLLVARHETITPWSVFLIMSYPIVETLFSMVRKKLIRKMSPDQPDGLHFHMLVYKRLALRWARNHNKSKLWAHAVTALLLSAFSVMPMLLALFTYHSSALTLLGLFGFVLCYCYMYRKLLPISKTRKSSLT